MKHESNNSNTERDRLDKSLSVKLSSKYPRMKSKSPEYSAPKNERKSLIQQMQMTSTAIKKTSEIVSSRALPKQLHVSDTDISGIFPLKPSDSIASSDMQLNFNHSSQNAPALVLPSNCEVYCQGKKTVPRKKVKSPIHLKPKIFKSTEMARNKVEDFENQLKKKQAEILNLQRKVNSLQKIISDKNGVIKDLEIKFPKMIYDLKKGLNGDSNRIKMNQEIMKDSITRNRQLSGNQKYMEVQLKVKEEKLRLATLLKDKTQTELEAKEKESREFMRRLKVLEKNIPEINSKLDEKDAENRKLQQRIYHLNENCQVKDAAIEQMSAQIFDYNNNVRSKNDEIISLNDRVITLQNCLRKEAERVTILENNLRGYEARQILEAEDESALDPTKDTISSSVEHHEKYSEQDDYLDVFEEVDNMEMSTDPMIEKSSAVDNSSASEAQYDISAGTLARAEELERKVEGTWSRVAQLSCQAGDRVGRCDLAAVEQFQFSRSVSELKADLDQSILHHTKFLNKVSATRKLFHN